MAAGASGDTAAVSIVNWLIDVANKSYTVLDFTLMRTDNGNGLRGGGKEDSSEETTASNPAVSMALAPKGHLLSNHGLSAPTVPHQQVFTEGDNLDGQR